MLNAAVVTVTFGSPKLTVPGPLTWLQIVVSVPTGKSSSLALPFRLAVAGSVIV